MIVACDHSLVHRATLAAVLVLTLSAPGRTDEPNPKPASKDSQHVAGVIVKAERVDARDGKGEASKKVVLTINTAAVWRDWVRDQANAPATQSARKDAKQGAESVAAKGEPRDENTLVKVEVAGDSKVETRFRAPDDETARGVKRPDAPAERNGTTRQAARPTEFRIGDLKPGLFVETDFRRKDECNVASSVVVVRPIPPAAAAAKPAK